MSKSTIYQKIWDSHLVQQIDAETALLYVDLQLLHEVTSPQAFAGLSAANRKLRHSSKCLATLDHAIPTANHNLPFKDEIARIQVETLRKNCEKHSVKLFDLKDKNQGIVHIIGPEQGITQPGMVIVCGDSHTSTHGAFGALAFGIGTSEVEHVMATQCLIQKKSKTMRVNFTSKLPLGLSSKDMILALIGKIGTAGGAGYVIEYSGEAIESLSQEARMTICNMSIEAGAKAGLIAPDQTTIDYIMSKPFAPKAEYREKAIDYWRSLNSAGATFDREVTLDVSKLKSMVTWGTSPDQVVEIDSYVPSPDQFESEAKKSSCINALEYMGLAGGERIDQIKIDRVFIGSCTNARIEDLRIVAKIVAGKQVSKHTRAMIVPGSGLIKAEAEAEGLAKIFVDAGFDWREPGCSMCLGMNEDILSPHERCASTSNRNYEGRQGKDGRTHLVSPAVAAATAIAGKITAVQSL